MKVTLELDTYKELSSSPQRMIYCTDMKEIVDERGDVLLASRKLLQNKDGDSSDVQFLKALLGKEGFDKTRVDREKTVTFINTHGLGGRERTTHISFFLSSPVVWGGEHNCCLLDHSNQRVYRFKFPLEEI